MARDKRVPVTTVRRLLRLRMEEGPPVWRVAANVSDNSRRQPIRGGPQAWGLGEVSTSPQRKSISC